MILMKKFREFKILRLLGVNLQALVHLRPAVTKCMITEIIIAFDVASIIVNISRHSQGISVNCSDYAFDCNSQSAQKCPTNSNEVSNDKSVSG